jgi:GntR family transcriptional repressor for pyruvate dehydrogenase complex
VFEPVQKQSLSDAVFEQLRDKIVSGEMEPGTKLPSERVLCEMLGVNRGAVREALKRLEQARLVSIQQGGATRILAWRESAGLNLMTSLLFSAGGALNIAAARSVVEMRSALAPDIARLAALRGGARTADALELLATQMGDAGGDLGQVQTLALAFWGQLASGSGNVAYRLAYNTLRESYQQFQGLLTQVLAEEYRDVSQYAALADAVRRGDTDGAEALARDIIKRGEGAMLAMLDALQRMESP